MTSIGILGAGRLGSAIAKRPGAKGIAATIANSRGPETLSALIAEAGPSIKAGTREEVASKDVVFVSVIWPRLQNALANLPTETAASSSTPTTPCSARRCRPSTSASSRRLRSLPNGRPAHGS
ncbi:NAD(P)-binding domain-containing protein [Luteimonas sp. R10]|uniref:NAD(P)-binding domain-containing protein n=1 Tax=Luteimonas sp. R10 TaxID=3108176 RepID=UPI003088EAD6|nr:NAD(P)-binding domain-containing protein [Luteimonas sp. R10]